MNTIKILLDGVRMNDSTGNTSSMAMNIAMYERALALVSDATT